MDALHAALNSQGILCRDRGDRGHRMAAQQRHGPDIRLDARAPATIGPSDDQDAGDTHALYLRSVDAGCRVSRSEEHTSELQSLMRISYAVFCLKKKTQNQ